MILTLALQLHGEKSLLQFCQFPNEMELVRIRHGVAQYAMKSRVRAYKNRAKGSGWQANWREHFCHSLTLKTSVFPLSIRLLFGPITSLTVKKINVCGRPGQPGSRWWRKSLRIPHVRMVKLRKLKKALRTRFIALYSLLSSHFEFLPDKRHKNDYIVRFRCKYPFFLFFTTCHISLFQVDLASH